ncbi:trihelix transcription factor GT-2-like [Quillaja saponaria]|uniref:Trihelix transcription factor GT-2-like n=1 Tax=Quillaja saponaria TaxID=32244 RepID=A0AAD7KUA5_QUISA|nr:trihelix transcription factor GT-2-like [Quillaja saponaria]
MLEISSLPENPGAAVKNRENEVGDKGVGGLVSGGFSEEERIGGEEGDRNSTGNRWPQEETLALLKIRSDMDVAFRDVNPKAPLWEEVSRKLAELGFNRGAKKCKEKFENIYKYYRRTKEGRSRTNGKTYRFFEQLEALDSNSFFPPHSPEKYHAPIVGTATATAAANVDLQNVIQDAMPCSIRFPSDNSDSITSSSSKEWEGRTGKKKRKLTEFFGRLMKEVIEKQENLQRKFMEVLDKCEHDRLAREEAWKMQELERLKRERELLVQERSIAAAKDAAVLALLQKFTEQAGPVQLPEKILDENTILGDKDKDKQENQTSNGGNAMDKERSYSSGDLTQMSSSRWPKDEVEALIRLRTNLDLQYQGIVPKIPLWEDISAEMKKIGYNRNAKRCKEKWENINKYFKRIKEKNRKKPEDSKTCPYFQQLDALYSKKPKKFDDSTSSGSELKPEELLMHIMGNQEEQKQPKSLTSDQNQRVDNENDDGHMYQIVSNSTSSMAIMN